jgi:hypothetical protein
MKRTNERALERLVRIQGEVARKHGQKVAAKVGLYCYAGRYFLFSGEKLYMLDERRWKVAPPEWSVDSLKLYRCDLLAVQDEWLIWYVLDALKEIEDGKEIAVEEE